MMNEQKLQELFWKYSSGTLNHEEERTFFNYLAGPLYEEKKIDGLLQELWLQEKRETDPKSLERIEKIMTRIKPNSSPIRVLYWPWAAVACLLLLLLPYIWTLYRKAPIPAVHKITTVYGQKKSVRMWDGSVVFLNAGSELEYTDDYNHRDRIIKLTGEAYFETAKNKSLPFIVQTGPLQTLVLGTTFNIQAHETENIHITVTSGAVRIVPSINSSHAVGELISAGQQLDWNGETQKISIQKLAHPNESIAWKSGVLTFDKRSFPEVAIMLERWFAISIHFNNPSNFQNCRFTGTFNNPSLQQVLDLLQKSSPFSFNISGKDIYISGAGCQ